MMFSFGFILSLVQCIIWGLICHKYNLSTVALALGVFASIIDDIFRIVLRGVLRKKGCLSSDELYDELY